MLEDGSWGLIEDDCAAGASVTTNSTVWGPGALTGKFLKAVGEIGLDMIVEVILRRRLSVIKRTLKKRPAVFLELESQDAEESQTILRDLEEMCQDDYSDSVREAATALMDVILVYQKVPVVRQALVTRRRLFTKRRRNKRKSEEDMQLANKTFEALMELMNGGSDDLGIAARRLVESITDLHLELRALDAKKRKARALALARDLEYIEHIDIMVTKETKTVYMDEIKIRNVFEVRSPHVRSNSDREDEKGPLDYGITVTKERMTDMIYDTKIGQISGLMYPDVRARSVIIEENMMAQYLESPVCLASSSSLFL